MNYVEASRSMRTGARRHLTIKSAIAAIPLVMMIVTSCSGETVMSSPPLPSEVVFTSPKPVPDRWNADNNYTSYEPCTQFAQYGLASLGVDPDTWTDVSEVEGVRGCRAISENRTFTAFVGNVAVATVFDQQYRGLGATTGTQNGVEIFSIPKVGTCVAAIPTSTSSAIFFSLASETASDPTELCRKLASVGVEVKKFIKDDPSVRRPEKYTVADYLVLMQLGEIRVPGVASGMQVRALDDQQRMRPNQDWRDEMSEDPATWQGNLNALLGRIEFSIR